MHLAWEYFDFLPWSSSILSADGPLQGPTVDVPPSIVVTSTLLRVAGSSRKIRCLLAHRERNGINDLIFFGHENSLFGHNRSSTFVFSMKMAESEKIVLASCILDFKDIQVWLRHLSLNLNACRKIVMTVFYEIPGQILKKTVISLQALRFKLKCLDQSCISSKSSMQLAWTIFSDSATFNEKKRLENRLWPRSEFSWPKKKYIIWHQWTRVF